MSLIDMSAISLACCLSFVQNGAERSSSCWLETADVRALSHGAECAPRKAPDSQDWNLSPFLLPVPNNRRTLISFRKAIKYLKASLCLLMDVG